MTDEPAGDGGPDGQVTLEERASAPERGGWLSRPDASSPTRVFASSLAFVALAAASLVVSVFAQAPPATVALVGLMMAAFGLGELSGRPRHVLASRVVGLAIFVATVVVVVVGWSG